MENQAPIYQEALSVLESFFAKEGAPENLSEANIKVIVEAMIHFKLTSPQFTYNDLLLYEIANNRWRKVFFWKGGQKYLGRKIADKTWSKIQRHIAYRAKRERLDLHGRDLSNGALKGKK